jgi:hypothetical protein
VGRVRRLFANGVAELQWQRKNGEVYDFDQFFYWSDAQVSPEIRKCHGRICPKDTVLGGNGANQYTGTVRRIFRNGTAEVKWERANGRPASFENLNYWQMSNLTPSGR